MGRANADSLRYGQRLPLDGVSQVPVPKRSMRKAPSISPTTAVSWAYAQSHYRLTSSASLLGGLRWNITHETRDDIRVNSRGQNGHTGRARCRSPHRLARRGMESLAGRG
jgi:hypothetical protein